MESGLGILMCGMFLLVFLLGCCVNSLVYGTGTAQDAREPEEHEDKNEHYDLGGEG